MEERDFDVIVVGAGCAGAVAAYVAAKQGKNTLLIDRGEYPGAKNMTGGRIYAHALKKVIAKYEGEDFDWEADNPFERKITHERICLLDAKSALTFDHSSENLRDPKSDSYSVLATTLDQWLCDKAEAAGAELIFGIPVEELVKDDSGAIIGIRAGEDTFTSHVVILAEGQNTLLAERCLGVPRTKDNQMAVGIKEVFELDPKVIEDRFLCPEGEGAAMLFVGDCTHGNVGGGFLYTNKSSISLGLVATIKELSESDTTIYQAFDDFKKHPCVAPIIRDAKMSEHSGHMIAEGGYNCIPETVYPGCVIAGDTANLCMNLGYQVRGLDFATASGQFAAEAACAAIDKEDVSAAGLSSYKAALDNSFVTQDLRTFKEWPATMESWESLFTDYPKMAAEIFDCLFVVDGKPQAHLMKRLMPIIKKRGIVKTGKEVMKAVKAL